ncbi:hypothetical protein AMJ47_03520 [Parcubacteria bacterium DG_72]|nr:MAG: hypothetical protein AMJ47_03520 [Parcubacteria bacterium DG_72]
MKNNNLNKFIDSIDGFSNFQKIEQIVWFVFFKIEIEKNDYVNKGDVRSLFTTAWINEPNNFDQLWGYLVKKKKILVKQDRGFVLNREKYKELRGSYSQLTTKSSTKKRLKKSGKGNIVTIPSAVLKLLPKDVVQHCNELNENLEAENWISSMLLMRKILPLAIIRKFQIDKKESNIKDSNNEYLSTEKLLKKSQNLVEPRIYKEIKEIKLLYDGVQHLFTFSPRQTDISPAIIRLRVFLEGLFKK